MKFPILDKIVVNKNTSIAIKQPIKKIEKRIERIESGDGERPAGGIAVLAGRADYGRSNGTVGEGKKQGEGHGDQRCDNPVLRPSPEKRLLVQ